LSLNSLDVNLLAAMPHSEHHNASFDIVGARLRQYYVVVTLLIIAYLDSNTVESKKKMVKEHPRYRYKNYATVSNVFAARRIQWKCDKCIEVFTNFKKLKSHKQTIHAY
jgi:hypothetical protein